MKTEDRLGLLLWFRLSRFYSKSIRETNQHLKKWNVSAAQFDVLAQVGGHDRLTQQELGNKLFVTKGNITQLLNKMEQLEWIRREQEGTTKHISLTEKGRALYEEIIPPQETFQAEQFQNLNVEEQHQLLQLLKKLQ
ncbi:MarR family transcriptional regulator [Bacillus cereus]|uniref:MarR family winged helix-turn-helix transcriptional regulator n=1 Tax=Bacillus cereus group TaxID=86661 RepID=UPI00129862BB|nr:MarR family transcriptional regulator [Bacillus cereus]MRB23544.1 MarR family transcriptional regulator [Bacillus thuringiensis]MCU5532531.1 MarR family transcriptional regulator [Bacillus cereus]MDA1523869.1 MarR family transcriptional regulator [Bacillus cereus]MDA1614783.1 MarR family transcriptional regulator [Bacillus cereus]MDA2008239.1 MarR family transcriptional regulator [Bacillus cereus]